MLKRDLYYERIPTKSLRDDVRYLGNILGRVIKEQEGENFFEIVEKIRKLSKANKINPNTNQTNRKVIRAIKNLSPKNTLRLIKEIEPSEIYNLSAQSSVGESLS